MRRSLVHVDDCGEDIFLPDTLRNEVQSQRKILFLFFGDVYKRQEQGRGCRFPAPRPCSFFVLAWTIRSRFCGFEYTLSSTPFPRDGSRRNTGIFSP